jgi:hypothetical protein
MFARFVGFCSKRKVFSSAFKVAFLLGAELFGKEKYTARNAEVLRRKPTALLAAPREVKTRKLFLWI